MFKSVRNISKAGLASVLLSGVVPAQEVPQQVKKEKIGFSQEVVDYIAGNTLEQKLYNQYGRGTEFFLETKGDKAESVCVRNGNEYFRKPVEPQVADAIRRVYSTGDDFFQTYEFNGQITEADSGMIRSLNDSIKDSKFKQKEDIVAKALDNMSKAGKNSVEFLRALDLISKKSDDEMTGTAIAYIARMEGMGYRYLEDKDGAKEVVQVPDLTTMNASTFYENLVAAFEARNNMPWGRDIPQEDFFDYVLPARVTQEPLQQGVRRHLYQALAPIAREMKTPEEFLTFANKIWAGSFRFTMTPFEDQSTLGRLHSHTGRCEDCVNAVVDMAKAVGIPAYHLSVNAWPKGNDNHTWVGMKKKDEAGKEWNFSVNAGFPSPTEDPHAYKGCVAAKVSRIGPFGLLEDVTAEFTTTGTASFKKEDFLRAPSADEKTVNMHVINYGMPVAVYGRPIKEDGSVEFKRLGNKTGILYLPAFNRLDWRIPSTLDTALNPFIFQESGEIVPIGGKHDANTARKYDLTGGHIDATIGPDQTYELDLWDNGAFKPLTQLYSERVDGSTCILPNVSLSERVIYFASKKDGDKPVNRKQPRAERPFVVLDGKVTRF